MNSIDVCFITPNNSKKIYQELSSSYSAIEPPTWSLLLAESCRSIGFKVAIIDSLAENLDDKEIFERIEKFKPKFICFVVYGQNVNAGTTNMSGATRTADYLKNMDLNIPIGFIGSHVQALPIETLKKEKSIDIVFMNEGVYSLRNLLKKKYINAENLSDIKGIAFKLNNEIKINSPEKIVPQDRMDIDLPGYAWDLLPFKQKRFDLYRAPMWHAEYDIEKRTPYAAIQTSLGCQFGCDFCMINIINRNDNEEIGVSSNYSNMRYWSTEFIFEEFKKLINFGVHTVRIVDEMFLLNPKYYKPLCEKLSEINSNDDFRFWAYSRVDTVKKPEILSLVRKAGIKWLCLGIESGKKEIRLEISKGKFEDVDIREVVKRVHDADIEIMANYIFGLPGDDKNSMKETFDLSKELCTSGWNTYAAMALPGSALYKKAIDNHVELPKSYESYSFHAYDTLPLPTEHLTPSEILKYRDECYIDYHNYPKFLTRIEKKYGNKAKQNIVEMSKIKLKRKIIEDNK